MAISSLPSLHLQRESAPSSIRTEISTSGSTSSSSSSARHEVGHDPRVSRPPPPLDNERERTRRAEEDDDDHDPSLWVDIDEHASITSDSSTSRSGGGGRWRRRSSGRCPRIKVQIPSLLCDFVTFFWDWTFAAFEVWMEVLSAPPFPLETLQKVSIVLLGVERIRDNIDQSTLIVFVNPDGTPMEAGAAGWTLASIPHYLIWGIPGLIALLSISFVLTLQLSWGHQEEAVIATALILLIFLEALLPLFILGCTSMFLFQQVSWETGLVLLVIVWLGSTFCAHCIRRMLYQSLGHG